MFALQTPNAAIPAQFQAKVINALRGGVQTGRNTGTAGGTYFQFGWTSSAVAAGAEAPAFPTNDASFPPVFGLPVPAAYVNPPAQGFTAGNTMWLWLYLRRPANPFDTRPYAYREMVTVDAIRFPFTYASGNAAAVFSTQRLQPFRGGHLVPQLPNPATANNPFPATCWGFSEQTANGGYPLTAAAKKQQPPPQQNAGVVLQTQQGAVTIPHSFAVTNGANVANSLTDGTNAATDVDWDYFAFNDRDFTSVAELMLVPGCPPGLFTKQFVENNDPWDTNDFNGNDSDLQPTSGVASPDPAAAMAQAMKDARAFPNNESQTYPYLVDKFFYSAASVAAPVNNPNNLPYPNLVGTWTGDGWYKLLEFVEVPSSANGAIGPVASTLSASGDNFDWFRQDVKPGQLNLNLISVDEEVFFGLMDDLRLNDLLNTAYSSPFNAAVPTNNISMPLVVTQIDANGYPVYDHSGAGRNGYHNISDIVARRFPRSTRRPWATARVRSGGATPTSTSSRGRRRTASRPRSPTSSSSAPAGRASCSRGARGRRARGRCRSTTPRPPSSRPCPPGWSP